jgi:S1-C subfamily serine protease
MIEPNKPARGIGCGVVLAVLGLWAAFWLVMHPELRPAELWPPKSWTGRGLLGGEPAGPRTVTPRGDLAADEQATIRLFRNARGSVVSISTSQLVEDVWSQNVYAVPRGTGSGLIWDDAGHVLTNFHVIEGASEATIRLADGRKFRASLVGASPEHDIAVLKIGVAFRRPPPIPWLKSFATRSIVKTSA